MISSATLFLATLALHFAAVLGAPISVPADIAPRSLDNSGSSVRFTREESFPEVVPAFVKRAVADVFPVVKRETEAIVRRYPRRFIYEHLEKRGTIVHEKVTVIEKTIKHDNPIDTVAYNNGQPHNNNGDNTGNNNGGVSGFTTSIGFSTTIAVPGVPTPTATSTSSAPPTPTPTPDPAAPANGGTPDAPKPDAPAAPGPDGTTTTTTDGGNPATPSATAAPGATATGTTTTTDGPKPDAPSPDGTSTTTTTTGGNGTPAPDAPSPDAPSPDAPPTPAPAPDGTTTTTTTGGDPNANAGGEKKPVVESTSDRREIKADATAQPIAKRELAKSGAVWASSLRRRAL